jgi:APA family basic amino acid/polyamine antiporter
MSLANATIYGIGSIVGAGIYVLIGVAAGLAGNQLWLSFLVAAIIAGITALSYAKLSSFFSKAAAESFFAQKAFNHKGISFFLGYLPLILGLISAAAVSWGFATYFKLFTNTNALIVAFAVLALCVIINLCGLKMASKLNAILTGISVLGLVIIIFFGIPHIGTVNILEAPSTTNLFQQVTNIFAAGAIMIFAFLGFEQLANISEEIKESKKNVPKAILLSLGICTILYILISIVAVNVIPYSELAHAADASIPLTEGPLAKVAEQLISHGGFWISLIALFATSSTILIIISVAARILYGLAEQKLLPEILLQTNKNGTPWISILMVFFFSSILLFSGNLNSLGSLVSIGTFLLFAFVNLSLIKLNRKKHTMLSGEINTIPFLKETILPIVGFVFCVFMFLTQYWAPTTIFGITFPLIIISLPIFAIAIPIYYFFNKKSLTL